MPLRFGFAGDHGCSAFDGGGRWRRRCRSRSSTTLMLEPSSAALKPAMRCSALVRRERAGQDRDVAAVRQRLLHRRTGGLAGRGVRRADVYERLRVRRRNRRVDRDDVDALAHGLVDVLPSDTGSITEVNIPVAPVDASVLYIGHLRRAAGPATGPRSGRGMPSSFAACGVAVLAGNPVGGQDVDDHPGVDALQALALHRLGRARCGGRTASSR